MVLDTGYFDGVSVVWYHFLVTLVGWYDIGCCCDGAAMLRSDGKGKENIVSVNCF